MSGSNVQMTSSPPASPSSPRLGTDASSAEKRASATITNRSSTTACPPPSLNITGSRPCAFQSDEMLFSASSGETRKKACRDARPTSRTRDWSRSDRSAACGRPSTTSAARLFSRTTSSK
jgi:hypothetical protein